MKDALEMVDQAAGDDKIILVASSNGGWVSTYVASVRPEKIVGLVLIGTLFLSHFEIKAERLRYKNSISSDKLLEVK